MTDPTGHSFLSYRRIRGNEAERIIAAQRERGIPTWRDFDNMNTEPAEDELRRILRAKNTANVILWITPEIAESGMITKVEAPLAFERHRRKDGFFIVPVAAGGTDYADAAAAIGPNAGLVNLKDWNIIKLESNPADDTEIAKVANAVLKQRLQSIDYRLQPDEPLLMSLHTRQAPAPRAGTALNIDWRHRFGGIQQREASTLDWQNTLLPALSDVRQAIQQALPGRNILANGLLSLPAATALGSCFMTTAGLSIAWEQRIPNQSAQIWSLKEEPEESGFDTEIWAGPMDAPDLAVMVSVNNDVTNTIAASFPADRRFRAYVHIKRSDSAQSAMLSSPGQALDVAHKTIIATRNARGTYDVNGNVHLFTAVPAGLAMLIGQLSNTLGPIQTYEHIPANATGYYSPAALLNAA